jgi:hypothetical protein
MACESVGSALPADTAASRSTKPNIADSAFRNIDVLLLSMTSRLLIWVLFSARLVLRRTYLSSRANVRQVLAPVAVTDARGRPVRDLKRADFKVFEDGAPEEIAAFSASTDTSVAPPDEVHAIDSGVPETRNQAGVPPRIRRALICCAAIHCTVPCRV